MGGGDRVGVATGGGRACRNVRPIEKGVSGSEEGGGEGGGGLGEGEGGRAEEEEGGRAGEPVGAREAGGVSFAEREESHFVVPRQCNGIVLFAVIRPDREMWLHG